MSAQGDEYRAFLRSVEWLELKREVIARAGWRCQFCGSPRQLEAHHRSYRDLSDLSDLVCLCRECHTTLHKHRRLWDDLEDEARQAAAKGALRS